ncbi:MAG: hypothetical protein ABSH34_02395 [Verrucomicrobiota bacterium]
MLYFHHHERKQFQDISDRFAGAPAAELARLAATLLENEAGPQ